MTTITTGKDAMTVPLLDLGRQHDALMPEFQRAFEQLVHSGQFILGPFVDRFEQQLAGYCGVKHAIGVSSGTDALLVALMALGIGPGDEVITSPFTFFATAGTIARVGAKPVFVDINPRTYNMQVESIEGVITRATKAILPVHLYGLSADMGAIMEIARANKLHVIEDAAQAIGARYKDRHVGTIGDVGCYSFYPSKNLAGLGDGGACVTNNDDLAKRIRTLRVHGGEPGEVFHHIGGNFRFDAMQAALLSVKVPHLDKWCDLRRRHADRYARDLEDLPVTTPFEGPDRHHVYNQYTIRVRGKGRDPLRHHLDACGVGNRVYYATPLHLQPCFSYLNQRRGSLPNAEAAADEVLSIPVFPEMTQQEQDRVVDAFRDFFTAE